MRPTTRLPPWDAFFASPWLHYAADFQLPGAWMVLCILHLTVAITRLLGEFVDREARLVTLRSVRTCKFSCRRVAQLRTFTGQLPCTGKKRLAFFRHGRILLGARASG